MTGQIIFERWRFEIEWVISRDFHAVHRWPRHDLPTLRFAEAASLAPCIQREQGSIFTQP
jgi:hypothetical protein